VGLARPGPGGGSGAGYDNREAGVDGGWPAVGEGEHRQWIC
jgi:hypothetical protein